MAQFQPYVGPRPFDLTEKDRNRFFGRNDEASELLSCIVAHSTVLLYSQSGAGKTSLINAKLIPMLEEADFKVLKPARVRDIPPADLMLGRVPNIFTLNVLRTWDAGMTDAKALAGLSLSQFLEDRKPVAGEDNDPNPRVAILDQFEELFTSYPERSGDREDFFDQIGAALEKDRLLRVIFSMREDYIAELDPYLPFLPDKLRTRYRIERLSEDDALLAITEPLRGSEYSFADGVAEQLVENLLMVPVETANGVEKVRGDSVEPVQLQVVCQTLWDNCQESWEASSDKRKVITRENLEEFGDVDEALSRFYEKAIKLVTERSAVKEGILRRWFEQSLITSAGTRGTVFRGQGETGGIPNTAVDLLVNQHIIRAELRGGSRWYELTHDRFIAPIKASNERWLLAHSGGAQTPKRLETRAEQWMRDGQTSEALLDEGELLEARRWLESPAAADVGYSTGLVALVEASRAASEKTAREREQFIAGEQQRASEAERARAEERQQRLEVQAKSARRLRWLAAALVLLVIGSSVLAVIAWRKASEAETQKAETERLRLKEREQQTELTQLIKTQAEERDKAQQEKEKALQEIIDELDKETTRANRAARIARLNEAKAIKTETETRAYYEKKRPLDAKNSEADRLFDRADNLTFEDGKKALETALALYQEVIVGYRELGENTEEIEARKREVEKRLKRPLAK
jgi:hypothetical protein